MELETPVSRGYRTLDARARFLHVEPLSHSTCAKIHAMLQELGC